MFPWRARLVGVEPQRLEAAFEQHQMGSSEIISGVSNMTVDNVSMTLHCQTPRECAEHVSDKIRAGSEVAQVVKLVRP